MQTISKLITQIGQRLLELRRPFKLALAISFLLLLALLLYPFEIVIVPAWNPRVVDDLGTPVKGIKVTEHWQHYQLENAGHEDFQVSDEFGRVSFPARTLRSGLFARFFARVIKFTRPEWLPELIAMLR